MITYERVTYKPEGAERSTTIILRDPVESSALGGTLSGIEVNREAQEVAPRGVDERRHIISLELISKRTPLKQNLTYGLLEPA
jgi:hypothetical protein